MSLLGTLWDAWWHLLLNILVAIDSVVNNPGIAIILFTLLIRLLTVPLTMKSLRSSRNMQQIQPLIKEVQKKYAKDRAKQQEETMKIYQQYGVNPTASCLPMLVQLPIFIGLYSALSFVVGGAPNTGALTEAQRAAHDAQLRSILFVDSWYQFAVNFSRAGFLWVSNLAKPDPLYIWPVLSGIFQFIQSRMAMPLRDPNQPVDAQTKMMNNMMQFMPIYIVVISLGFPAGTVIYWAFSNLYGAIQQYFITGFGTLPNLPGLGWLPRKPLTAPEPPPLSEPSAAARPARKGVMSWMMDKALEAQEAQKATQATGLAAGGVEEVSLTVKGKGKGSEQRPKIVPANTVKYGSDLKREGSNGAGSGASNGNGADISDTGTVSLPRKRRGKR